MYRFIEEALFLPEPIVITGKRGNVVLISENDGRAVQQLFIY